MERREFLGAAVAAGTAVGAGKAEAVAAGTSGAPAGQPAPTLQQPIVIDGLSPSTLNDEYVGLVQQAGVTGWHKTLSEIHSFADAWRYVDENPDRILMATTAADLERAQAEGKVGLMLGWQTATPLGDKSGQGLFVGDQIPADGTALRAYYHLGLRFVNLTYNTVNAFGAGCVEPHLGITRAGRRLVEEIHGLGIILDIGGHTGEQTSLDAIAMSEGVPLVCTHTNVAALCDNPRNTSDRVFEAIAGSGGVIGVSAINDFVARNRADRSVRATPQVGIDVLLDHYDYLKRLVGPDHVGIGADFTWGRQGGIDPDIVLFGREMASEQTPINYVRGFEVITELPNLVDGLRTRGWTQEEIDNVCGLNWMRVYRQVWGG